MAIHHSPRHGIALGHSLIRAVTTVARAPHGPAVRLAVYILALVGTAALGVGLMVSATPAAASVAGLGGMLAVFLPGLGVVLSAPSLARRCVKSV